MIIFTYLHLGQLHQTTVIHETYFFLLIRNKNFLVLKFSVPPNREALKNFFEINPSVCHILRKEKKTLVDFEMFQTYFVNL